MLNSGKYCAFKTHAQREPSVNSCAAAPATAPHLTLLTPHARGGAAPHLGAVGQPSLVSPRAPLLPSSPPEASPGKALGVVAAVSLGRHPSAAAVSAAVQRSAMAGNSSDDDGRQWWRWQVHSGLIPQWAWTGCPDLSPRHPLNFDDVLGSSWVPLTTRGHVGHPSRTWWWWPSPPSECGSLDPTTSTGNELERHGCQ
jgi:hypothetical protein